MSVPQHSNTVSYDSIIHKPTINGTELVGDKTPQDLRIVSENTTAGWNANPLYLPKVGEICVYTDHKTYSDGNGNTVVVPGIKIGDGNSYLIDMSFVGEDVRRDVLEALGTHENDTVHHVTSAERAFWNNKLNYNVLGEELILTRD